MPLSPQTCFGTVLSPGTAQSVYETPHDYRVDQAVGYWTAVGVRPASGDDWDLLYFEDSDPVNCVANLLGYSNGWLGVDLVCVDFNHVSPNSDYVAAQRYSGFQPGVIEWDSGTDQITINGLPQSRNTGPGDVLEVWDVHLLAGTTYSFRLQQSGGALLRLLLFENTTLGAACQGRAQAVFEMSGGTYDWTPSRADWYGLVVVNDNGVNGTYTVEVGTCETPTTLANNLGTFFNTSQAWFQFTPATNYWIPIGVRSGQGTLKQEIYGASSGGTWPGCFADPLKTTPVSADIDLIMADLNHLPQTTYYSHGYLLPGPETSAWGYMQWEGFPDGIQPGLPASGSVDPAVFVHAWDISQQAGYPYTLRLSSSGPLLFLRRFSSADGVYWKDLTQYTHQLVTMGGTDCLTYRSQESDICGLVVTNEGGMTGTYAISMEHPLVDATSTVLADQGKKGRGVAAIDYDGDMDLDLVKANFDAAGSMLFRNNGGGSFTEMTPASFHVSGGMDLAPQCADYDNDGDTDLYMCNNAGHPRLFRNDGGTFTNVPAGALNTAGSDLEARWADFNRDGDMDLFVVGGVGGNQLFQGNGVATGFVDVTPAALRSVPATGVEWIDYDLDRDPDLFIVANNCRLFRNDGGGAFTDVTSGALAAAGGYGCATWADYDNDGDPDLYLGSWAGASNRLIENNAGTFVDVTMAPLGDTQRTEFASWGDWDNDGDLDLTTGCSGAPSRLYLNDGDGAFFNAPPAALAAMNDEISGVWSDLTGDGALDLYVVRQESPGTDDARFLRNDGCWGNHWLEVDLSGQSSTTDGAGARIRVVAGSLAQVQQLTGSGGRHASVPFVAHFGLGSATTVDSVLVYWPAGSTLVETGVPADQRITLREGVSGVEEPPGGSPLNLALESPAPNPFSSRTTVRFDLPAAGPVDLAIYDVAGRVVRVLSRVSLEAGRHSLDWDGRDDSGTLVASGFYFLKLAAADRLLTRKVVVAR